MDKLTLNTDRIIGLFAPQRYGKTTIMHYLIEEYAKHITCFIYDTDIDRYKSYSDFSGNKNINFVYPKKLSDIETQSFYNKSILFLRSKYTNFCFITEDIDKLIQSKSKSMDTLEIYKIASDSRHQRIAMIYSSKTPSYIPTTLRLNTNLFFFGKFVEPAFVDYITKIVPKELYARLQRPDFIMFDVWTGESRIIKMDINKNELIEVI